MNKEYTSSASIYNEGLALRNIKVFLSSTFQDMEMERNYLAKYTFPRVADFCMRQHISFMPIDLRWGITDEEDVLKVCFDEIERSEPFFIGLVGGRYGWVPLEEDFKHILDKYQEQIPWITQAIKEQRSVTELEFLFGALKRKGMCNAVFYVKENIVRESKQEKLKDLLVSQSRFKVRSYSSIENLGELVYTDMVEHIQNIFPNNISEFIYKKRSHEFKLHQRIQSYVHMDTQAWKKLNMWYEGKGKFCAICENVLIKNNISYYSSPGKSMLLCNFINYIRTNGASTIYYDIQAINEDAHDFINDLSNYIESFIEEITSKKEVLIAIDNLDCLVTKDIEDRMVELLNSLPHNAKILISTRHTAWTMRLPFEHVTCIEPSAQYKGLIIDKYLSIYGKKMSSQNKVLITSSKQNMKEIRLMLDALLRFGSFENLKSEIEKYSNCFIESRLIDDIKSDIGNMNTGNWEAMWILNAIALSGNAGLSENEIVEISGITALKWASIRKRIIELCVRQGAFYIIDNPQSVKQELLNKYYSNFQDLIINRMKQYISEKGMAPWRLAIILPSLYSNYFGANDDENNIENTKLENASIYQDLELVNNMSIYSLVGGWNNKYLKLKVGNSPQKWTLRKVETKYNRSDLVKYYTRLKIVTEILKMWDNYKICINKLYELTLNKHQYLLNQIPYLCHTGKEKNAVDLFMESKTEGNKSLEAAITLARCAFDMSRFDIFDTLQEILYNYNIQTKEDSDFYYEVELMLLEQQIAEIYASDSPSKIKELMNENSIFDKLNKCLKALYHKGKNDRLICKLCQLIGYANMMAGKYDFAIKYWMNQYVECTFNVYTAYSLEYQQALIEYGLCFIKIGEIKMANDHFRGSKIFSYSPEQLKKPWIINSLELLLRMEGVDFVYKKECQRLLNDIIKGIEDQ